MNDLNKIGRTDNKYIILFLFWDCSNWIILSKSGYLTERNECQLERAQGFVVMQFRVLFAIGAISLFLFHLHLQFYKSIDCGFKQILVRFWVFVDFWGQFCIGSDTGSSSSLNNAACQDPLSISISISTEKLFCYHGN